jgi:membrane protein
MTFTELAATCKSAFRGWLRDDAAGMGAALSFYTLFSMAPLLLLVIGVAGIVIGADTARELIFTQLESMLGAQGASAIQGVLRAADSRKEGIAAAAISLFTLVLGATTVFAELRKDLDRIWQHDAVEASGVWGKVRARLFSFGLVLTIGFLLMVSLALSAALTVVGKYVAGALPFVLRGVEFLVSFLMVTGLFAMIYKILPSARIQWKDVWVGAAVTSLLFWIGKYLIGLYIARSAVASPFGAAGTLVVVIVWVYYSSQIFFLGAEFTRAYALRRNPPAST